VFDLKARNIEQRLALNLLLDPEVVLVALDGPAGTGKTLLAIRRPRAGVEPSRRTSSPALPRRC